MAKNHNAALMTRARICSWMARARLDGVWPAACGDGYGAAPRAMARAWRGRAERGAMDMLPCEIIYCHAKLNITEFY